MLQVTSRSSLAKTRRRDKARGCRVLNDGCGCYSVIDTKIEPPRPLVGLDHVPLWVIEQVITTPLPEPPPRRQRTARPVEPTPIVEAVAPVVAEAPAHAQAHHSFLALVEALKARGGAS
jgi:hypothetical protein